MLVEFDRFQSQPRDSEIPRPISADTYRDLVDDVQLHTGLACRSEAECVVQAVLAILGEAMAEGDRQAVASMLPQPVAQALQSLPADRGHDVDAVYHHVAASVGIGLSTALEYTQAVCQGMSRTLERGALKALRSRLPEDVAELFSGYPEARPSLPRRRSRPPRVEGSQHIESLAGGRPGPSRPLSEAGPGRREGHRPEGDAGLGGESDATGIGATS